MGFRGNSVNLEERKDENLTLRFLQYAEHPVHRVPTYFFRMVHSYTGEELGAINLRIGSNPHIELYGGHVGFSVHEAHRGQHYAARAVRLLAPIAKELGFVVLLDHLRPREHCIKALFRTGRSGAGWNSRCTRRLRHFPEWTFAEMSIPA